MRKFSKYSSYLGYAVNYVRPLASIPVTLDNAITNDDEITTYTVNSVDSFDIAVTTAGTNTGRPLQVNTVTLTTGMRIRISFDAVVNSGLPIIKAIFDGVGAPSINYNIVDGYNSIEMDILGPILTQSNYWRGTNLFDVSITNYKIEEFR